MATLNRSDAARFGYDFIPPEHLPPGKDEYWLRNTQVPQGRAWRKLTMPEREILEANNNFCSNWDDFLVTDPFDPSLIRNSQFYGLVRIGVLQNKLLQHHDFCLPAGIRNSCIISCDIGDDTAIQDCSYISHYIIGNTCILSRIDEMQTTNHAKFGSGVLKDGEDESVRICIDVINEAGGRPVLAFPEMIPADAYLWACYRDDTALCEALKNITQKEYGGPRGLYGIVGSHSAIKSCKIIKDVFVGEWAYIKGANKLKNISVLSSKGEPSQIGEGVEMVNGIMGYGCNVFYGVKAVRFVLGRRSSLKYGARLVHSVLGDNSTVSCCEILNNLVFPSHEQHHNNSFLIASLIQGMSNLSAGTTIGSNHNSRSNDGEVHAGRGFWPGLSVSLKHSSRFASFTLIIKGNYPNELNISLPFSLVSNNETLNRLEVMPAYYWMHNLYALERNSWKTLERDRRKIKKQQIETDYLAPDTAEEIIAALSQMEPWMKDISDEHDLLSATGLERQRQNTVLLKPRRAREAYRQMLLYYALKTLAAYLEEKPELSYTAFAAEMENQEARVSKWLNLGGQIVPAFRLDRLREQIRQGEIDSWKGIHAYYDEMAAAYPLDRARHAWEVYRYLEGDAGAGASAAGAVAGKEHPLKQSEAFRKALEGLITIHRFIAEQVHRKRAKDLSDPFWTACYRNAEEMEQVLKNSEASSFVKLVQDRAKLRQESTERLMERLHTEKGW
jgi:hypothetical protein